VLPTSLIAATSRELTAQKVGGPRSPARGRFLQELTRKPQSEQPSRLLGRNEQQDCSVYFAKKMSNKARNPVQKDQG
jgi:hypothetical protein